MSATSVEGPAVEILEMRVDAIAPPEAVRRIVESPSGGRVLTPNLQHLRAYRRSAAVRRAFAECELVVADGMPLIWASRLQGTPLPARVAGSDLVWSLSAAAASESRSLFLLGGDPGTAEAAERELCERFPGLRVAGTHCPPHGFEHSPAGLAAIDAAVSAAAPDLVYIGLPLEKQLLLMERLRDTVPSAWLVGLGGSFSFVSGEIRRAPTWAQRSGLEWAFRLGAEPRRLGRRYLVEGLPFFVGLIAQSAGRRLTDDAAGPRSAA
jgi:N-acetylglucosaminyldiphosphoundecaprenol N-acetyl-beta-D-mannosaminyltransferase